ncbi:MAG TPA: PAS domain S-box protein, partial [Gemmataceae bacterium]|nr:PAS domain S-box protein [Gemmataceae bacterium]
MTTKLRAAKQATHYGEAGGPAVPDDVRTLRAVVEGTARGTGREFFRSLVRHLAEAIDVRFAVVAEFPKAPPHVRTLAFWERDRVADNFEYDFTGTPCAEVVRGGMVHYPAGVSARFPKAAPLVARHVEGYLAVPFLDKTGNILGHLAVFDDRPLTAEPRRLSMFQIFAARASAELERMRTEERLEASEARYRDLFENAPNAYLIVGNDGRIQGANRRVTEMFGYPIEELVGASIHSFVPDTPAGRARSLAVSRKHLAGESVAGWELEMRRKDGRPLWIQLWMEPNRDADGAIQSGRSFFYDITGRVLAERERDRLRQQTDYLREEIKAVHDFEQIIGRSPSLMAVLADVARVAPTNSSVL